MKSENVKAEILVTDKALTTVSSSVKAYTTDTSPAFLSFLQNITKPNVSLIYILYILHLNLLDLFSQIFLFLREHVSCVENGRYLLLNTVLGVVYGTGC